MTRLIAGRARGRRLKVPRGDRTRPTADRTREALFSALEHRTELIGARVLDLFAGAGTLGLEAASRGAARVVLVEADPGVVRVLRENVAAVGGEIELVRSRVERFLAGPPEPFDLVLLDPPYAAGAVTPTLAALLRGWLAPGALVCVEHPAEGAVEPPEGLTAVFERRYGAAGIAFLEQE